MAYEVVPETVLRPLDATPLSTLDEAMKHHIHRALAATNGRIEGPLGAAKILGINSHTFRARMRRLGIEWSRFRTF